MATPSCDQRSKERANLSQTAHSKVVSKQMQSNIREYSASFAAFRRLILAGGLWMCSPLGLCRELHRLTPGLWEVKEEIRHQEDHADGHSVNVATLLHSLHLQYHEDERPPEVCFKEPGRSISDASSLVSRKNLQQMRRCSR
eukprot:4853941-Amphidinium_carterae.1